MDTPTAIGMKVFAGPLAWPSARKIVTEFGWSLSGMARDCDFGGGLGGGRISKGPMNAGAFTLV